MRTPDDESQMTSTLTSNRFPALSNCCAVLVALRQMAEGTSSGEENANFYMRGVNEGCVGGFLHGEELLAILDVFGEDGLRAYIVEHLEGVADAMEGLEDRDAAETKQPKVTKTEKGSSPIRNPSRYSGEVGYPPPAHRGGSIQDLVYALPSIPYSHDVGG